jgi:type II secretion system protein D
VDVEDALIRLLAGRGEPSEVVADPRQRRILVRGSAEVHALVRQAVDGLDRPADNPFREPREEPVVQTYSWPGRDLEQIVGRLQRQYEGSQSIRIVSDARRGQIVVLAPPSVHNEIALALGGEPSPRRQGPTVLAASMDTIQLNFTSGVQLEAQLAQLLGSRLTGGAAPENELATYVISLPQRPKIQLHVNRRANQVVVSAAGPATAATAQLIRAIDSQRATPELNTVFVPFERSDPAKLRRALDAYKQSANAAIVPIGGRARQPAVTNTVFQQPEPIGAEVGQPPVGQPGMELPGGEVLPGGEDLFSGLIGPVEVQVVPELGIIILRGAAPDVEKMKQLIAKIEEITRETEPLIEVYPLKHADSSRVSALVTQLYEQVYSSRSGRVNVTALVKPNALLLIGSDQSIATLHKLIEQLDQPVSPDTQFEVFALQHAPALVAKQTIDEFFANRATGQAAQPGAAAPAQAGGGLSPNVQVTADYRTNSLIVQASPRDMAEVALLVSRLDTAAGGPESELRVFTLNNALADELAPVLQAAIDAALGSTTRQTGAQGGFDGGQFPGQGGAASGTSAAQIQAARQKSSTLRFLTLDAEGQKLLRSGILTDVHITADPRANALLVVAPPDSMELLAALIKELDTIPAATAQIKVFTIVNGDATSLVEMLEALLGQTTQGGGQGGLFNQQALSAGESSLVPLRFSVDARTNSIIATGSRDDLLVVEAILLRLDESDVRQRKSQIYRLKNAYSEDVAAAINEFLRSEQQIQQIQPGLVSPFEQIEREVVVVPEVATNSLIVSATPRYFEEIADLVEQLDERPPMVVIQVLIGEVQLNNTDEFGVELGLQDSLLFDRSLLGDIVTTTQSTTFGNPPTTVQNQTIQAATLTPGYNFNNADLGNSGSDLSTRRASNVAGQALSSFALGRVNGELGFGGLVLAAGSDAVSVLIRALSESRRLDVLSRPQVMTMDNQPAFVQVGERVPRITGSTTNEVGQTNQTTLENVGLLMQVRPRISPDGLVVMEIDAEKSSVGPESEGIPVSISATGEVVRSPRIETTLAQTTISAASGQTVILGGLITKNKINIHRRVPVLSDIPILGNLFRYDRIAMERTELLIILTPHIVRNEEDAERIKQIESARMHWCLADVTQIHGPSGVLSACEPLPDDGVAVVYPDDDPTGTMPEPADPAIGPPVPTLPEVTPGVPSPPGPLMQGADGSLPAGVQQTQYGPQRRPSDGIRPLPPAGSGVAPASYQR